MSLKVALLEASTAHQREQLFYPLGLAYIGGYLKNKYPSVDVAICRNVQETLEYGPHLAGISAFSSSFPVASSYARLLKRELNIPLVLGGPHISALPMMLPPEFDAAVVGEGEKAFSSIVSLFIENAFKAENLLKVPGVVCRKNDRILEGPPCEFFQSLDEIPFPYRNWKDMEPLMQWIFTSRGCPYRCTFCSASFFWKVYRAHSAAYVAKELKSLADRFNIDFCIIMDDLFAFDLKRLRAVRKLLHEKLPKKLSFSGALRAELAREKICNELRKLGLTHVQMGLESGSDSVLKCLKGSTSAVSINEKALKICSDCGLKTVGSFIIGAPGEDEEDLEKTCQFIKKHLDRGTMESFSFSPMVPFPGTGVWDYAIEKGLIDVNSLDWSLLDINIESFSAEKYLLLTDKISRKRFAYYFEKLRDLFRSCCR